MICAKCGREMPDTDRYCGICGTLNRLFDNAVLPQEYTGTQESALPVQEPTSAQESVLPVQEPMSAQESVLPVQEPMSAQESVLPVQNPMSAQESALPVQEPVSAQESALPAHEPTVTQTENMTAHGSIDTQADGVTAADESAADLPAPDFAAGIHTSVARVQSHMPPPAPAQEYRPYPPAKPRKPKEKVKRTCSLSVVIFCGILIFLLSVLCGVFAGLYFGVKPAAASAPHSITEHAEG